MPPIDPVEFPRDDLNPYAPPRTDVRLEPVGLELPPVPFTIGAVLERTWQIYRDRMGLCIGTFVLYMVLYLVVYVGQLVSISVAQNAEAVAVKVAGGLRDLALLPVAIWLSLGLVLVMLDIARGREASVGGLFGAGRFLWRALLAVLLFYLSMAAVVLLGYGLGGLIGVTLNMAVQNGGALVTGMILLGAFAGGIVAYIFSLRYSQFVYLILDRDMGPIESLQTSFQITQGNTLSLFVLSLVAFGLYIGGAMLCGIGLIFTAPGIVLLFAVTYVALTSKASANPYAKGELLTELDRSDRPPKCNSGRPEPTRQELSPMPPSDPTRFPSDEPNPYAPPRTEREREPEPAPLDLAPGELSIGDVLARTWDIYRDRMGICVGINLAAIAINQVGSLGFQFAMGVAPQARNPWLIVAIAWVAALLFSIWIKIGQTIMLLDVARGRNASWGDVFQGGRVLLPVFVSSFLLCLQFVTVVAVAAVPALLLWSALGGDSVAGPVLLGLGVTIGLVASIFCGSGTRSSLS